MFSWFFGTLKPRNGQVNTATMIFVVTDTEPTEQPRSRKEKEQNFNRAGSMAGGPYSDRSAGKWSSSARLVWPTNRVLGSIGPLVLLFLAVQFSAHLVNNTKLLKGFSFLMGQCAGRTASRTRAASLSTLSSNPTSAVMLPGNCVFSDEWTSVKLVGKEKHGSSSVICTFELPDPSKPLGLSTCACVLAKGPTDEDGSPVVRPYTPISTNALIGKFDLLVKVYPEGKMSRYLANLPLGGSVDFKHIGFNVKIQYPFNKKKVGILCGGTGVAPMIQALHAVLGTPGDPTLVSMLYGSKCRNDILAQELLDSWASTSGGRLAVTHVLSQEPSGSSWKGARGHIDEDLIKSTIPSPDEDCIIFVCGPPGMYESLCGPRAEKDLSGVLAKMGYSSDQVYKF
jgi:cytochrome-b5 reductase